MTQIPDTRASLIVRLPNASDAPAWREFAEIYEPFVYQFARRRGLQDSDAREVVQEVFMGVAKAIKRFDPDPERAKFRTWLFRIARNQMVTVLTRKRREQMIDSGAWAHLDEASALDEAEVHDEAEYRREVFRWASRNIQRDVQPQTWHAFWQTYIVGRPVAEVADSLGIPCGTVYVARSRVIQKLRQEIKRLEGEQD